MTVTIASITGEIINDSRGVPTLSVTVTGSDGSKGTFSVPSGASTGIHEAHELRDDTTSHGNVTQALALLTTEIQEALVGKDIFAQKEIDTLLKDLDGTSTKSRLGGNTLIGVSIALCKAAAQANGKELFDYLHTYYFNEMKVSAPRLYANLINGGKHANTKLAFQEYHVVPKTTDMKEAQALITSIQEKVREVATTRFDSIVTGDEGGYALPCTDIREPLDLLEEVTRDIGVREQVDFALDVAASSFFNKSTGVYSINETLYTKEEMIALYENIAMTYDLLSIEDPFEEEDFSSFTVLKNNCGKTLLIGDDLTTTSSERLSRAIQLDSIHGLIIKPNQIGTLTETIETMKSAFAHGIKCIVSHRSGETLDDFIADLAYATGAFGIKAGARGPKEREVKYSRLAAIDVLTRATTSV